MVFSLGISMLASVSLAHAQSGADNYPAKPITMIVAYPPGGSTDVTARIIADKLGHSLGQAIVVENRAGASGTIGASYAAQAKPDGYTIFFGSAAELTIAPVARQDLNYNPLQDFEPVTQIGRVPFLLVVNPKVPSNNLQELIEWLRSRDGAANYSSFGANTVNHLVGESFLRAADVKANHVPYKGSAPSIQDVIGGHIDYTFDTIAATLPQIRADRLKPIAISTEDRSVLTPDVPTLSEAGLTGFSGYTWSSVLVPAGTSKDIVQKLYDELAIIVNSDEVRSQLGKLGIEPVGSEPRRFQEFIQAEITRWSELMK